jgi:hypothetical protein
MNPISTSTRSAARNIVLAALLGTSLLPWPAGPAQAQTAAPSGIATPAPSATQAAPRKKRETVEARIARMHTDLQITAEQESRWANVARTMRANAADMEKLIAAKRAQGPQYLTAIDDLKNYQEFAKAHLDGLVDLTASFKTLYDSMPDAQKRNADKVFGKFDGHRGAART